MVPLTVRSSSPRPPSVMVKVAVLPDSTRLFGAPAASVYQCGELSEGVGPYFQYCAPAANAVGKVTVTVIVPVQLVVVKSNNPSGKLTPAGAGTDGPTNAVVPNVQVEPPPDNVAVAVPVPVNVTPLNTVTTGAGRVTFTM